MERIFDSCNGDNIVSNYVQYKFNVDGEWRHNEQEPFVSGNFGVVNTILVSETDISPAILSAERTGRSRMEVDSDVFAHVVSFFSLPIFVLLHFCICFSVWIVL